VVSPACSGIRKIRIKLEINMNPSCNLAFSELLLNWGARDIIDTIRLLDALVARN
jgi:hypothetical protein